MASDTMERQARHGRRAWEDTHPSHPGGREIKVTPRSAYRGARTAARGTWRGARAVTRPRQPSTSHLLAAELVVAGVIVGLRVLGDYEVTADGTQKGTINAPENGGFGPFTVIAGLIGSFFLLSFLAAGGGTRARIAVAAGALIDLVLLDKSLAEIEKVAGFIIADPSTRTVQTTAYTSADSQAWGAAEQIGSGSSAVTLTSYVSSAPTAYGQTPFNLGGSTASAAPAASSTGPATSSGTVVPATSNPTSIFPTVSPSGVTSGIPQAT